jgi:hypothetical protein
MAIVMQDEVDFADTRQHVMDFDPENLMQGKVDLRAIHVRLTCVVNINSMPDLQQGFQKEPSTARSRV